MGVVVVMQPESELLEMVLALAPPRGLPRLLHSRQQQCNQDSDDRNDDQKLDEREPASTSHRADFQSFEIEEREFVHNPSTHGGTRTQNSRIFKYSG